MTDHYKLLGIAHDADKDRIKRAYRDKVRLVHPDLNPSADAAKEFILLKEAVDILSDDNKRMIYDLKLKQAATTKQSIENFHYDFKSNLGGKQGEPAKPNIRLVVIIAIAVFVMALAGAMAFFLIQ